MAAGLAVSRCSAAGSPASATPGAPAAQDGRGRDELGARASAPGSRPARRSPSGSRPARRASGSRSATGGVAPARRGVGVGFGGAGVGVGVAAGVGRAGVGVMPLARRRRDVCALDAACCSCGERAHARPAARPRCCVKLAQQLEHLVALGLARVAAPELAHGLAERAGTRRASALDAALPTRAARLAFALRAFAASSAARRRDRARPRSSRGDGGAGTTGTGAAGGARRGCGRGAASGATGTGTDGRDLRQVARVHGDLGTATAPPTPTIAQQAPTATFCTRRGAAAAQQLGDDAPRAPGREPAQAARAPRAGRAGSARQSEQRPQVPAGDLAGAHAGRRRPRRARRRPTGTPSRAPPRCGGGSRAPGRAASGSSRPSCPAARPPPRARARRARSSRARGAGARAAGGCRRSARGPRRGARARPAAARSARACRRARRRRRRGCGRGAARRRTRCARAAAARRAARAGRRRRAGRRARAGRRPAARRRNRGPRRTAAGTPGGAAPGGGVRTRPRATARHLRRSARGGRGPLLEVEMVEIRGVGGRRRGADVRLPTMCRLFFVPYRHLGRNLRPDASRRARGSRGGL